MKRRTKKLFSLLLSLALVVGMIPTFGVTASAFSPGDIPGTTGAGTASDPVIVDTFEELKEALQLSETLYIRVDSIETTIPDSYTGSGDYIGLYAKEIYPEIAHYSENGYAIWVKGKKFLKINTNVVCKPQNFNQGLAYLMYVTGDLTVSGTGMIACGFNSVNINSVFYVAYPGTLTLEEGITVKGGFWMDNKYRGSAIVNDSGTVTINGGSYWGNSGTLDHSTAAVVHRGGTTTITGGKFESVENDSSDSYGFSVAKESSFGGLSLSGGTYKGIRVQSGKAIADLLAEGCHIYDSASGTLNSVTEAQKDTTSRIDIKPEASAATPHTITVDDGTADKSTAKAGETVTISAKEKESFMFTGWTAYTDDARSVSFADRFSPNTTFIMPDCDVRMVPNYKYSGAVLKDFYVYITPPVTGQHPQAPTVNTDDYSVSAYNWVRITDSESKKMTASDVFEEGIFYQCRVDLQVKDGIVGEADELKGYVNGSAKTDGMDVMISRNGSFKVKVIGSYNCHSAKANPFVDVSESDYFYEPVLWAVDKGITNGTDATHFSPAATCTRGQVVTFLWRAAGSPAPSSTTNPFTDVTSSDYYYNAVLWAVGKNITNGTSPTTFGPNDGCTRGQVVTFLHRFENLPSPSSTTNSFVDVSSSEYYYTPVLWAMGKGITNGTDATHFSPNATCTRGQIVTFLYRDMK